MPGHYQQAIGRRVPASRTIPSLPLGVGMARGESALSVRVCMGGGRGEAAPTRTMTRRRTSPRDKAGVTSPGPLVPSEAVLKPPHPLDCRPGGGRTENWKTFAAASRPNLTATAGNRTITPLPRPDQRSPPRGMTLMAHQPGLASDNPFLAYVTRLREHDELALQELIDRYAPVIRLEARMRLRSPHLRAVLDSMDICQSVLKSFFLRAAAGQFSIDRPEDLRRLLVQMACNKSLEAARREYAQRRDVRRSLPPGAEAP